MYQFFARNDPALRARRKLERAAARRRNDQNWGALWAAPAAAPEPVAVVPPASAVDAAPAPAPEIAARDDAAPAPASPDDAAAPAPAPETAARDAEPAAALVALLRARDEPAAAAAFSHEEAAAPPSLHDDAEPAAAEPSRSPRDDAAAKARAFAQKRQQHYNMAGLLGRKWDEEDEMEDDDAAPPPLHDDAAAPSPPPPEDAAAPPPPPPHESDDESAPLRLPATGQTGTQWSQWTTGPASQRAASQWATPPPPAWDDALRRHLRVAAPAKANAACVAYAADERARAALPTMNVSRGDVDVLFAPDSWE